MSYGFIQIPRSLLDHPTVRNSPHAYFRILITIIEHACFIPCDFNDHGKTIHLLPGQFCCTERQLAELANVSRSMVTRAISRFSEVKILSQEVNHTKTIITITHPDTYSLFKKHSNQHSNQDRTKIEPQKNNANNLDKEKQQQQGESCFADFAAAFYERLKEIPLSQEDIILFSQDEYSQDRVDLAIDYIKTKIEEGKKPDSIIATLRWHCKLPKPPKANSKKSTEQQEEAEIFNKFLLDHGFIELHERNKLSILKNVAWIILSRMPTSISLLNLSTEIKKDFEQSKREILNDKQRKRECQSHTI